MKEEESYADELSQLVNAGTREGAIQRFFERNPHLLTGSHFVLADALISQFRLGADFRPDFAYVEPTSGPTYLYLIEIENPALTLFNAKDEFTQEFNHAYQQIIDWAYWVERNQGTMMDVFRPLFEKGHHGGSPFLTPRCRLIAGRRAHLTNVRRKERFESKSDKFMTVRTYDGIIEHLAYMWGKERPSRSIQTYTYRERGFYKKKGEAEP